MGICVGRWIAVCVVSGLAASSSGCTGDEPAAASNEPDASRDASAQDGGATSHDDVSVTSPKDSGPDVSVTGLLDAGPEAATSMETSTGDAQAEREATPDVIAQDGGTALVLAGANLTVRGITSDGFVVYLDNAARSYYAIPLGGGTPILLFALAANANSFVSVYGKLVILQTWGPQASYACQLTIWSSALAQPVPISNVALLEFSQTIWPSDDSNYFVYTRLTNFEQTTGALYGVKGDGTNQTLLVPSIAVTPLSCVPKVTFPGGGPAVISYCPAPGSDTDGGDGGPTEGGTADAGLTRTIQAFSPASSWSSPLVIPNSIAAFALDPSGAQLVTASAAGNNELQVFPLDGAAPGSPLDPGTPMGSTQFLVGATASPWSVVYNTGSGVLKRAVTSPPSVDTLVEAGANYFSAVSRDGKLVIVAGARLSGAAADLTVASTTLPGTSQLVATSAQYNNRPLALSTRPGGAFTPDQKNVIFFSDVTANKTGALMGYIRAMPLDAPQSIRLISNGYNVDLVPLTASKVLLLDNYHDADGGVGSLATVDIDVIDVASTNPAINVLANVPRDVAVSPTLGKVVYSVVVGGAPGIYAVPIP